MKNKRAIVVCITLAEIRAFERIIEARKSGSAYDFADDEKLLDLIESII